MQNFWPILTYVVLKYSVEHALHYSLKHVEICKQYGHHMQISLSELKPHSLQHLYHLITYVPVNKTLQAYSALNSDCQVWRC